jgi:hypothetical protein
MAGAQDMLCVKTAGNVMQPRCCNLPENMSKQVDINFRLGLLERAMMDSSIRIGDLTERIARFEDGAATSGSEIPEPFEIKAEEISPFAIGFYAKETDNDNRTYRWTGSINFFEFRFALNRDVAWAFNMQIATNPNVNIGELRAFADYAETPIQVDRAEQNVSGTIPIRRFSNIVTLSIYQPSVFVPQQLDPSSEDRRSLGIVFYNLTLTPALAQADTAKPASGFFSKAFR